MYLTIYGNEAVSITQLEDGYTRVLILRDGQRRLQIDTLSQNIEIAKR